MNQDQQLREALIDPVDSENRAVRCFLMFYTGGSAMVADVRENMRAAGFPYWPEWVEKEEAGALSKLGAQNWLRHLFALEALTATQQAAPSLVPKARWCDHCCEGVALFCGGENASKCHLNLPHYQPKSKGLQFAMQALEAGTVDGLTFIQREAALKAVAAALLEASTQREQPAANRTHVDSGALTMALNVLRRAGKAEVADALEETAVRGEQQAASKPEPQAQAGEPLKLGLWDSQWVNIVNDLSLHDMDKEEAIHHAVKMAESKCIENAQKAIAKKDAALKACVEALDQYSKGTVTLRNKVGAFRVCCGTPELTRDHSQDCKAIAAITQGQEAQR